jgi:hypothetical protein
MRTMIYRSDGSSHSVWIRPIPSDVPKEAMTRISTKEGDVLIVRRPGIALVSKAAEEVKE